MIVYVDKKFLNINVDNDIKKVPVSISVCEYDYKNNKITFSFIVNSDDEQIIEFIFNLLKTHIYKIFD